MAQCSRYGVQPTAVAVLSKSLCSDAGAVFGACKGACMHGVQICLMLELLFNWACMGC